MEVGLGQKFVLEAQAMAAPKNPRRKRTTAEIDRDAKIIATMYLQGIVIHEIAKRVKMSPMTVSRDLTRIRQAWQDDVKQDFAALQARELAKIDLLEQTYWGGYILSTTLITNEKVWDDEEEDWFVETTEVMGARPGDPRFLSGARDCVKDRVEMLGLKAPERVEVTGKDGGAIRVIGGIDLENDI